MTRVFDVAYLLDVPENGRHAVVLTAWADIDLATETRARAEIGDTGSSLFGAVLLDLTHVFVGVPVVRCIADIAEIAGCPLDGGAPVVVVGGPQWLARLSTLLDLPPLWRARTVESAVAGLRAAAGDSRVPVEVPSSRTGG